MLLGVVLSGLGLAAVSLAYMHQNCAGHWSVTDSALEDALLEIAANFPPDHVISRGWNSTPVSQGDTVLHTNVYSTPTIVGPIQRYCRRSTAIIAATFKGSWDVSVWKAYGEYVNVTFYLTTLAVTFTVEFEVDATPENGSFGLTAVSVLPVWRGGLRARITSNLPLSYENLFQHVTQFLFPVFANNLFAEFMEYSALPLLRVASENAQPFSL